MLCRKLQPDIFLLSTGSVCVRKYQKDGGGRTRHTHQCCLLNSFHCSRPDSRNAVRARTPCAHLAGALRRRPGHQSASGCQGRGTAMKPGPKASSRAHPAGTVPHDALEAECHQNKCHWSCCNICMKKNGAHPFIRYLNIAECSSTDNSQPGFA